MGEKPTQGFQAQDRVVALISLTLYNGTYTPATLVSRENTFSEVKCTTGDRNPRVSMGRNGNIAAWLISKNGFSLQWQTCTLHP